MVNYSYYHKSYWQMICILVIWKHCQLSPFICTRSYLALVSICSVFFCFFFDFNFRNIFPFNFWFCFWFCIMHMWIWWWNYHLIFNTCQLSSAFMGSGFWNSNKCQVQKITVYLHLNAKISDLCVLLLKFNTIFHQHHSIQSQKYLSKE